MRPRSLAIVGDAPATTSNAETSAGRHPSESSSSNDAPIKIGRGSTAPGITCATSAAEARGRDPMIPAKQFMGNAAVVTLGCAKNRVDSEIMVGTLESVGYQMTNDLEQAEVVVVNTCGFLKSSVDESIDTILQMAELKRTARLRRLIVAGCLVERFKSQELPASMPEVDAFVSTQELLSVAKAASGIENETQQIFFEAARPYFLYDEKTPRRISTQRHTAYVKISEGCNRPCTFCIIPKIRGAHRSRTISSVLQEVEQLAAQGVREISLVAQDLTSFGTDHKETQERLPDLLRALDQQGAVDWVRLLYLYPVGVTDELLSAIRDSKRVCNYIDIPLQHVSERVLKSMQRPLGKLAPRPLVEWIRKSYPEIELRTTFIVGFPGETEEDVQELVDFVSEGHFSSVGVFTYSREEGTPSAELPDQIKERDKKARRNYVMAAQQQVVVERNARLVGQEMPVLLEGAHQESSLFLQGRTYFQAPEVDGTVIINDIAEEFLSPESGSAVDATKLPPGTIVRCKITGGVGYDLLAEIVGIEEDEREVFAAAKANIAGVEAQAASN